MSIKLTDAAINRIAELMHKDKTIYALRLSIMGGGCSGFSYNFELVSTKTDKDEIFEFNQARLLIDRVSLPLLLDSIIDFKDTLLEQNFVVNNPNATSSCGCGVSFSI